MKNRNTVIANLKTFYALWVNAKDRFLVNKDGGGKYQINNKEILPSELEIPRAGQ